jgi:hypothetical protein
MKLNTKASLSIAIAGALNLVSPHVNAVIDLRNSDPDQHKLAYFLQEQSRESTSIYYNICTGAEFDDCDLGIALPIRPSYEVTDERSLFLTVTLNNGVKFAKEPTLACAGGSFAGNWVKGDDDIDAEANYVGDGGDEGLYMASSPAALDKATAVFTFPAGFTSHANGGCILTYTGAAGNTAFLKGGSDSETELTLTTKVTYYRVGDKVSDTNTVTYAKFVTGFKAEYAVEDTGANALSIPKIDVRAAMKKFASTTTTPNGSTTETILGTIKIVSAVTVTGLVSVRLMKTGYYNADRDVADVIDTASVTVFADILNAGGTVVKVANNENCNTVDQQNTSPGNVSQVTVAGLDIGKLRVDDGINVCVTVDGLSNLTRGQTRASLVASSQDGFENLNLGGATEDLVEIGMNGARTVLYNLPHIEGGAGENSFIGIYNTNPAQSVAVSGTLYDESGAVLGVANSVLVESLAPNDVEVIGARTLQTKVGAASPWDGRAWLELTADIDAASLKVQALVRSSSGVLVNVSDAAKD